MATTTKTCPRCGSLLVTIGAMLVCAALDTWRGWAAGLSPSEMAERGLTVPPCDYEEVRREFVIPVDNLARLTTKVERLTRKASRLGCPAPVLTVGERHSKEIKRDGEKFWVEYVDVTISGESPRINGWTFAATIDHDGEENILRGVGGGAKGEDAGYPAKYRTALPACDHCRTERRRGETFLLRSDAGEWKQIGRSCLRDFLGHKDPAQIAAAAEYLAEAMEEAEDCWDDEGGGCRASDPDIEFFLAYVARAIRANGWTPRSAKSGEATVDIANNWLWGNLACSKARKPAEYPKPEAEDYATAVAALEWARALPGDSEFDANLRACSKRVAVKSQNAGLTAYIVAGYTKALVARHERAESNYVGTCDGKSCSAGCAHGGKATRYGAGKGKKAVPEIEVIVTKVIGIDGYMGATAHLHLMRDTAGNALTWKSSECLKAGARYSLTGTVKKHEEYRGTKQTVLTRCEARRLDGGDNDVERGQVRKGRDSMIAVVGAKFIASDSEGHAWYDIERIDVETGCRYGGQMRDAQIVEEFPVRLDALPTIPTVVAGEKRLVGDGTTGAYIIVEGIEMGAGSQYHVIMYLPNQETIDMGPMTPRQIVENFPIVEAEKAA